MNKAEDRRRQKNASYYRTHFFDKDRRKVDMTLDYLEKNGSITPLEALTAFGSFRLADNIYKLRQEGYVITTEIADGESFAIYTMRGWGK